MANKHINNNSVPFSQDPIDGPSSAGQFGWEKIKDNFGVPVIVRSSGIRFSPVRIVEQEIIKKYDLLPQTIFQCITLRSFYLTAIEAKLLNVINFNHCDNRYGETFFTTKDVVISAQDVKDLSRYLEVSRKIFSGEQAQLAKNCGVITISTDPHNLSEKINVPYICKYVNRDLYKFVPFSFVRSFVINIRSKSNPTEWDLMYLKMLCIYSDTNLSELQNDVIIIQLDGLCYNTTRTPLIYEEFSHPTIYAHVG